MSEQFPLYPDLPEVGEEQAVALIEAFKVKLAEAATEAIGDLYTDIVPHIESDAWGNFRNDLMAGLCDYGNRKHMAEYDFKKIRRAIFEEFHDEIIDDLNADMVKEIKELKEQLARA